MHQSLQKIKLQKRLNRHKRIRARIKGSLKIPRLSVFRSNQNIYAQLIDDDSGKTLVSVSSLELKNQKDKKSEQAKKVGELLAKSAKEANIEKIVFDRGGYKYHGRVKALAEGARSGGLKF